MWTCGFILHNVIINCVAKSYHSSDEKMEEWASFWKCLASSISSDKSRWWCIYRLLFESSTIKMIHFTKLFTTTLKSYILFEILWRLRRCSYAIYTTALFIKGASTKKFASCLADIGMPWQFRGWRFEWRKFATKIFFKKILNEVLKSWYLLM